MLKKYIFYNGKSSSQAKYHILGEKMCPVAWNQEYTSVIQGKKLQNANIKGKKWKLRKKQKYVFSSCPKYHSTQKLGSQAKRCDL